MIIACFNMLLTSVSSSSITSSIQEAETFVRPFSWFLRSLIFLIVQEVSFFAFSQQIRCCLFHISTFLFSVYSILIHLSCFYSFYSPSKCILFARLIDFGSVVVCNAGFVLFSLSSFQSEVSLKQEHYRLLVLLHYTKSNYEAE
jgi:hypothetical protein